jgi:hypothetical protein
LLATPLAPASRCSHCPHYPRMPRNCCNRCNHQKPRCSRLPCAAPLPSLFSQSPLSSIYSLLTPSLGRPRCPRCPCRSRYPRCSRCLRYPRCSSYNAWVSTTAAATAPALAVLALLNALTTLSACGFAVAACAPSRLAFFNLCPQGQPASSTFAPRGSFFHLCPRGQAAFSTFGSLFDLWQPLRYLAASSIFGSFFNLCPRGQVASSTFGSLPVY